MEDIPMMNSEDILIGLSKQAQNREHQFHRIYRNLCVPDMYIKAYSNIYSNKGSATSGINKETADGFSETKMKDIIEIIKNESYQATPVRRTYIPKKNGKIRPLGIPTFTDRLVQDICRMMLEAIYEPIFSDNSHGFRPNRSCHTALHKIRHTFTSVNWFIEGDIKGCFDNINHQVLISILQKRIKDERFIRLIWKFLKAGYVENWQYNNTFSGTPQGGIISPILANIYLNELDKYIEDTIKRLFAQNNSENRRRYEEINPKYQSLNLKIHKLRGKISQCQEELIRKNLIDECKELKKLRNREPYKIGLRVYKNLQYVRYADDFIIGVMGNKDDCLHIKGELTSFLKDELKLELSEEKTLITNSADKARFLNYEVMVKDNDKFFENTKGVKERVGNRSIGLYMPKDTMMKYINEKQIVENINAEVWRGKARPYLTTLSDLEIVSHYNAEIRGLYNYYAMAENVSSRMNMIHHLMEYSCLKTLANKHKTSVAKVYEQYRKGATGWGVFYKTKTEDNKIRFFYNQGYAKKENPQNDANIDKIPNTVMYTGKTELERRISAKKCEMCGAENVPFEIHHIHKIKDLKGKETWEKVMISRQRKTLVLCTKCRSNIHSQ